MTRRRLPLAVALLLAGCAGGPGVPSGVGTATALECAPYARAVTGLALFGDAAGWWDQAAGRYARGQRPKPGAVLVLRRSARLAAGHVAVVTQVVSERQILVSQANWVRRRITRDEPVQDVSAAGDWSAVRVWWAPAGVLGTGVYPAYGFIGPPADGAGPMQDRLQAAPGLAMSGPRIEGAAAPTRRNDG